MNAMQNPPMITQEERNAYGDSLLDLISRQAQIAFGPYAQRLANENQDLRNRLARSDARDTYAALEAEFGPSWKAVNTDERFIRWLDQPDPLSGNMRNQALRAAFSAGRTDIVQNFFRAFLNEHPEARRGSSSRSTSRSSGRPSAAGGQVWSKAAINDFYKKSRSGYFDQSDALRKQKDEIEADIIRAANEGRVVQ
jgi:hypothetical protein